MAPRTLPRTSVPQLAALHLSNLAPSGRQAVRYALTRAARYLSGGAHDWHSYDWSQLRAADVLRLRGWGLTSGYAVRTVNLMLCEVRAVAHLGWRLGLLSAEEWQRIADVHNLPGQPIELRRGEWGGGGGGRRATRDSVALPLVHPPLVPRLPAPRTAGAVGADPLVCIRCVRVDRLCVRHASPVAVGVGMRISPGIVTPVNTEIVLRDRSGPVTVLLSARAIGERYPQLAQQIEYRQRIAGLRTYMGRRYGFFKLWGAAVSELEAQVKHGETLAEHPGLGSGISGGRGRRNRSDTLSLLFGTDGELSDAKVRQDSSRWQRMARVPEAMRRAYYEQCRDDLTLPTQAWLLLKGLRQAQAMAEPIVEAVTPLPTQTSYRCIVIDPPWPMKKILRSVRPNQAGFDYPTMTEAELAAFPVASLASEDCHLFMWTTQKFLPMALRLLGEWAFRYVCTFVWHKSGGFQPVGLPQFNCEFVLYARRGTPTFRETTGFSCCFTAPRREHSRKPDAFYDMVRRVTAGPRIDIFSREAREGFDQFGNQVRHFLDELSV